LPDKLKAELSGILNWALLGLAEWVQGGLQEPEAVHFATTQYRDEEDILAAFIDEKCIMGPEWRVDATELHRVYVEWAKQSGEYEMSKTRFGRAMTDRGYQRTKSGKRWYLGIGLKGGL
jgi:putative DNA primase/helicase